MGMHITTGNFVSQVEKAEKPVLLDLYATWCGPCKMLAPILEEPELTRRFSVSAVPTLLLFKNGVEVKRTSGFLPKEALEQFVDGV